MQIFVNELGMGKLVNIYHRATTKLFGEHNVNRLGSMGKVDLSGPASPTIGDIFGTNEILDFTPADSPREEIQENPNQNKPPKQEVSSVFTKFCDFHRVTAFQACHPEIEHSTTS